MRNYSTGASIRASPALGSLDGDPILEVVAGSDDGSLYALDHNGNLLWTHKSRDAIKNPPSIVELYSNQRGSEIVYTSGNKIIVLSSAGKEIENYAFTETIRYPPVLSDINNDGSPELLLASSDNTIYIISKFFSTLKKFTVEGEYVSWPSAADVNGDGIDDLVFASLGDGVYTVYHTNYKAVNSCQTSSCLEKSVQYLRLYPKWDANAGGKIMPPLTLADLNGDGKLETVLVASLDTIHVFDSRGFNVMSYTVNGFISSPPSIADLDGDSSLEMVFGAADKNLYFVDYPNGSRLSISLNGSVLSSPAIADLTKDGKLEVIVGADDKRIYVVGDRFPLDKVLAAKALEEAFTALSQDDKVRALEQASKALSLYLWLRDDSGVADSRELMNQVDSSRNADVYLGNAYALYRVYSLSDAKTLAQEAFDLYSSTNNYAGMENSTDLVNKINTHIEADAEYKTGLAMYNRDGVSDESFSHVNKARAAYLAVGYSPGVSRSDAVLTRMKADNSLQKSAAHYSVGQYGDSLKYAEEALDLYSQINFEQGMNHSIYLMDSSAQAIEGSEQGYGPLSIILGAFFFDETIFGIVILIAFAVLAIYVIKARVSKARSLKKHSAEKEGRYAPWPARPNDGSGAAAPPQQKRPSGDEVEQNLRVGRISYLKNIAKTKKWGSGDPNDIALLMLHLKRIGLNEPLSLADAMEILSINADTLDRWLNKLLSRGWVRVFEINGLKHMQLTDSITSQEESTKNHESAGESTSEGGLDEGAGEKSPESLSGEDSAVVSKHVHDRLKEVEERLKSLEDSLKEEDEGAGGGQ